MDMNRNLPLLHLKQYDDLGALKLTIQKFYRINGGSTQYKGVEPDLVAPSIFDNLETGEKFMDYSLPWDQVEDADHLPWRGDHFDINTTRQAGQRWVAANSLFGKIKEETAKAKDRSKQTTVAVYLEGMREEREQLAATRKEAQMIGMLREDGEESEEIPAEKGKKLEDQLAKDPLVQLSAYLMKDAVTSRNAVELSQ